MNREMDVFPSCFNDNNNIKTLDRCGKRMEAREISFCQRNTSQSSLVVGAWIRAQLSFSLDFSGLWRKLLIKNQTRACLHSSEQQFRPQQGQALGMREPSGDSALQAGGTAQF